jgi:NOL1/NOP2/sun family putative RNA methylase
MIEIPNFLKEKLLSYYNEEEVNKIIQGYEENKCVTLRINTVKSNKLEVTKILKEENIEYDEVSWYEDAIIIKNVSEDKIRTLSIYEDGKIYLQSLSSMMPPLVLNPGRESILDMAAAPGGKTTQIYNLSNGEALITACEKNKIRGDRLKYNLTKQGATRVNVLNKDARELDDFLSFDKILLDAPCSGSGTINLNNENTIKYFNNDLVARSTKVQKELLSKAIGLLKKDHEMVYSTCSILREENEEILENFIKTNKIEIVPINKELFDDITLLPTTIEGTICVMPSKLYEGFFIAKIRKK